MNWHDRRGNNIGRTLVFVASCVAWWLFRLPTLTRFAWLPVCILILLLFLKRIGKKIYGWNDSLETMFDTLTKFNALPVDWYTRFENTRENEISWAIRMAYLIPFIVVVGTFNSKRRAWMRPSLPKFKRPIDGKQHYLYCDRRTRQEILWAITRTWSPLLYGRFPNRVAGSQYQLLWHDWSIVESIKDSSSWG